MDFLKNFIGKYFGGKGSTNVPETGESSAGDSPGDSPSFVSQFSSFADAASKAKGFLSDYSKDKAPSFSGSISGGSAGGYNLAKIPQSANSSFFQVQNPQPIVSTAPPEAPGPGPLEYIKTGVSLINLFCDIRLKTDIAPLESSDINDDLAEIAFFVKGLRDCA